MFLLGNTNMIISKNYNSLDCKQSLGLDVKQSPNTQDTFRLIPGLISYAEEYIYHNSIMPYALANLYMQANCVCVCVCVCVENVCLSR